MNKQHARSNYSTMIAGNRSQRVFDPVQLTVDELERSGRDLRNVTLEEFKALLTRNLRRRANCDEHLVSC